MRIAWIIWKEQFIEKLRSKHAIDIIEAEQVMKASAHVRRTKKGHIRGEDI